MSFFSPPDVPPPAPPAVVAPTTFGTDTTKLVGIPLTVIYGRVQVKGNVVVRHLSADSTVMQEVIALCWGPVTIWTNTILINEKRPEYINGVLNPDKDLDVGYLPGVNVWAVEGNLGQAPQFGLSVGYNRTAYLYVSVTASSSISSINGITVDVERQYLFNGGYNTPAAIPPQRGSNPYAAALDFCLNSDYGGGRDPTYFDLSSWLAGCGYADQVPASWVPGETLRRWSVGIEVGTGINDTADSIIELLLQHGGGKLFASNGLIKCWYPHIAVPVPVSLDRSNFDPKGVASSDIVDMPNVIEVEWQQAADGEQRLATWEDDSRLAIFPENRSKIALVGIPDTITASRMASYLGRQAFVERKKLSGTADASFFNLEPGDCIPVTLGDADNTWFSSKLFWVQRITPDNKDGDVDLDLIEYGGDEIYDDSKAGTIDNSDPIYSHDKANALPDPGSKPLPPTGISVHIGAYNRATTKLFFADLVWTVPRQPQYMHHDFIIYRREAVTDPWVAIDSMPSTATAYRDDTVGLDLVNKFYLYTVVSRSEANNESDKAATYDAMTQALIVTPPPPPINVNIALRADSGVDVNWSYPYDVADLDGFQAFFNPGTTFQPGTAIPFSGELVHALTKTSTFSMSKVGTYTIGVVAVDTFNHASTPAIATFTMLPPPLPDSFVVTNLPGTKFRFTQTYNPTIKPINYRGFEVRINIQNLNDWANSVPLVQGIVGGVDQIDVLTLPPGQIQVLLRAQDTFGNYSLATAAIDMNSSGPPVENIYQTINWRSLGWATTPSVITRCSVDGSSGDLVADSVGSPMYNTSDEVREYTADADNMYRGEYYDMIYETDFVPTLTGTIYLDKTIVGPAKIELKSGAIVPMYTSDAAAFYTTDPSFRYSQAPPNYVIWPGMAAIVANNHYGFRISIPGSTTQGDISLLTARLDVPSITENYTAQLIAIGGSRLTLTLPFTQIAAVGTDIDFVSGQTATTTIIVDKDPVNGPLIKVYDKNGANVAGTISGNIRGY